jgi:hypothetical protein
MSGAQRLSPTDTRADGPTLGPGHSLREFRGDEVAEFRGDEGVPIRGDGDRFQGKVLLDVAYAPWPSQLARAWAAGGGQVASGLDMLLHQAAEQVRLMTGKVAPVEVMRAALRQ